MRQKPSKTQATVAEQAQAISDADAEIKRTEQLIHRIAELEYEQRSSREQISRLTTDKDRIEAALKRLKDERAQMAADMEAALQTKLTKMLQAKEQEQQALREKIAQYQAETEQQMLKLRRERDEALALTQNNALEDLGKNTIKFHHKLLLLLGVIGFLLFSLLLFLIMRNAT